MEEGVARVFLLFLLPECIVGFGKYLQPYQLQKRREQEELENGPSIEEEEFQVETFALKDYSAIRHETPSAGEGGRRDGDDDDDVEIEVIAAVLIAGIFAFFILVYTLFLQCWWKCRNRRQKLNNNMTSKVTAGDSDGGGGSSSQCVCYSQTAWEQVDLEKCLLVSGMEQNSIASAAGYNS